MSKPLPVTRYRITPADPDRHLFEVVVTVEAPDPEGQRFTLPAWIPGSYLIREFARHVIAVRAECAGSEVAIRKQSKACWRAEPCTGTLSVTATVYAYDVSVRAAYLDRERGYFNGSSVLPCPQGREHARCELRIEAPASHAGWQVATTLARLDASEWGFGLYGAQDYEDLIDHPVELAPFARTTFAAGGVPHHVTISGRHDADLDRLAADLGRICQWHCDLFGDAPNSKAPFPHYLFQINAVGDGYGGLEHRSSTSLVCSRDELPRRGATTMDDDYRTFLGLASHEYFHAWHVKRIRPLAFVSADLSCERYTSLLWAFEGFTSYYDDLALVRSGVIDVASYLELAGRTITSVLRTPGRKLQSVAESSFDAWIKYYRQDENTPNAVVSYYAKGAVVALALDHTLRHHRTSLDELMRALWQRYGRTGVGVPEDGIHALASELARTDLSAFFARYVDGTDDPPLAELLADVGVALNLRASEGGRDRGGRSGKPDVPRASLGVKLASGEAKLVHVFRDGAAARAGLAAGDVIVAADRLKVSADSLTARIARAAPGERVLLHAFRRDELIRVEATLDEPPLDTCYLTLDESAAESVQQKRREWLGR